MPSTESTKPTRDDFVRWGTAPEDRQCRYTFANGYHCRRWSIRGHEYCNQHGRWMECRVDGPIEVPLMEDPAAVQLVASQTIRALGWGQVPPANGRAILHGCRIVQTGFAQELAEAKFRLKCQQLGADANQFLPTRMAADGHRVSPPTQPAILSGAPSAEDLHSISEAIRAGCPTACPEPGRGASESNGSPEVMDMGERDSAPENVPLEMQEMSATEDADPGPYPLHPTPYTLAPVPCSHPLDDVPPPPRPKSACDPCIAALQQGADESLVDCKNCPANNTGNLRGPQLPDPRNPPEPDFDPLSTPRPKRPPFSNLKTKWDDAVGRFEAQCATPRYPYRYPLQTEKEYADKLAAMRARPFDDLLRPARTSPPPPIPAKSELSS